MWKIGMGGQWSPLLLCSCFLLFLTPTTRAQSWGSGGCAGQRISFPAIQIHDGWTQENDWWYLRENGKLVEARDSQGHQWFVEDGQWKTEAELKRPHRPRPRPRPKANQPCACCDDCKCDPCTCKDTGKPCCDGCKCKPNYGIMREKMSTDGVERFKLDGVDATRKQIMDTLTGGSESLVDDSALLRLTVIGVDSKRQAVLSDLQNSVELAPYKDKLVVQDYPSDSWAVKKFEPGPDVTAIVQAPDGQVLARQDDYSDGAKGLAANLLVASEVYDPKKPQDARGGSGDVIKWIFDNPILTIAGVLGIIIVLKKK